MKIHIKEKETKGVAIANIDGEKAGEMTFSKAGATLIIVDHTEVSPTFSGKGVGKKLLYCIVTMAREKNIKMLPLCPFAAALFKKDVTIQDVLQ